MSEKWDDRFLDLAKLVSTWSKDPSTQVGAVIVRPDRTIASMGFNGFPQSMPDNPGFYANRDSKYSRIVHGEINALLFAHDSVKGCTLYTYPFMPCDRCCVQILQAGITRIVTVKVVPDERWREAFDRTKLYCAESHVELVEI